MKQKTSIVAFLMLVFSSACSLQTAERHPTVTEDVFSLERKTKEYPNEKPVSLELIDSIKRQLLPCWNISNFKDKEYPFVDIGVLYQRDGSVEKVFLRKEDLSRYKNDADFKLVADIARKALKSCPLKQLPQEDYSIWKELTMRFDPKNSTDEPVLTKKNIY